MDGFLNLEHSCSSILHLFCARTPYISSSCIALFYNAADFIVKLLKSHFCGEKSSKKLYVAHIYENPNNLPFKASRYTVQPGRLSGDPCVRACVRACIAAIMHIQDTERVGMGADMSTLLDEGGLQGIYTGKEDRDLNDAH